MRSLRQSLDVICLAGLFTAAGFAGTIYATTQLIDSSPKTIRAFLVGWLETIEFIRTHKEETVKIESAVTGFPPSVMSKEYDVTVGMFSRNCRLDAESLTTLQRSFVALKLLKEAPDMSKLYTEAFLPK